MAVTISDKLRVELAGFKFCFPIMERLSDYLAVADNNQVRDQRIGWHCHLTSITAAAATVLIEAGAQLHLSECNPHTTCADSVEYMRSLGARVHTGQDSAESVLAAQPQIISDTGLVLTQAAGARESKIFAGSEITTSGITTLRKMSQLPFAVININDGQLKAGIENFHGVGDGVVDALFKLTGRLWAGRPVAVVGYGRVGAGVACYLRKAGAVVTIVEVDPVRKLVAHYDGFAAGDLQTQLAACELLVTATGEQSVVPGELWSQARDGLIVLNVGHWSEETNSLKRAAQSVTPVSPYLERVTLPQAAVYLVTQGSPANVVMLTGSPEPTLIHLCTEMLCLNYLAGCFLAGKTLAAVEHPIPAHVEKQASLLALAALGVH